MIERLGDKASAKQEAEAANVPIVPGSKTPSEDAAEIALHRPGSRASGDAEGRGGGGGKGMRAVSDSRRPFPEEIEIGHARGEKFVRLSGLIVEKLVERGRHIEVQIAGDGEGNVIHLFERECSLAATLIRNSLRKRLLPICPLRFARKSSQTRCGLANASIIAASARSNSS